MLSLDDTIAAVSTAMGEGGIGIVRLSGSAAEAILRATFAPSGIPPGGTFESHRFYYGHVVAADSDVPVDEALAVLMRAPRTYTREDVAEVHCHGGIVPLRRTLGLMLSLGARLAEPGEFTLRAFLNGRIDLAQAEAVVDIVRAKTDVGLRVAVEQLDGGVSEKARHIRSALVQALASVEASLDFPDDEIPPVDLPAVCEGAEQEINALLARSSEGMVYRQGVRTAIVGRPNVGKSSLLNALLRTSRAIVAPVPGTTRDTLEETLNLRGIPLCLVDTAGITESMDLVEKLGIERSREALQRADLVLMVLDGSERLRKEDAQIASLLSNRTTIVVVNKIDLRAAADDGRILSQARRVRVSALTGEGLDLLEDAIVETVFSGQVETSRLPLVSNPRHCDILRRALSQVVAATESHRARADAADLVAVDLAAAISALGEITGETVSEDVLAAIFSNFCVGK